MGETVVKACIVDQGIGTKEEVGDEWSDQIQVANQDDSNRNDGSQEEGLPWLVIGAMATAKPVDVGEEAITANCLECGEG